MFHPVLFFFRLLCSYILSPTAPEAITRPTYALLHWKHPRGVLHVHVCVHARIQVCHYASRQVMLFNSLLDVSFFLCIILPLCGYTLLCF